MSRALLFDCDLWTGGAALGPLAVVQLSVGAACIGLVLIEIEGERR